MVALSVTPIYAGILAFLYLYLAFAVIRRRYRDRIPLGDGGNDSFLRTMRAHGNFSEYVPLALLLMVAAELGGAGAGVLHAIGGLLLGGRTMHAGCFLFSRRNLRMRVAGMAMTLTAIAAAGGVSLWAGLNA